MVLGEARDLESTIKYGEHRGIIVGYNGTNYLKIKNSTNLKQNYELSVTIDVENVLNPIELIQKLSGYKEVDIAITEPVNKTPKNISINLFKYDYESNKDFLMLHYGNSTRGLLRKKLYEKSVTVFFGSAKNYNHEKYLKLWTNFSTHKELGRNIFVTDNSEIHLIKSELIKNRSMMIVKSDELILIIECMHRHLGNYYLGYRLTTSKGLYYWTVLHRELPSYEKTWKTAVYGISKESFDFTKSLGDRCMSLLETLDDIKYLYLDDPNNEAEWSLVNKLNYFVILFTGILDNLAHLTSCRYAEKNFHRKHKVLRIPKNSSDGHNKFHKYIEEKNKELWKIIGRFQKILEIVYPIRDTVQHRGFLPGSRIQNLKDNWIKIMIKVDDDVVNVIKEIDEVHNKKINSWGLFVIEGNAQYIEPFRFAKKATDEILSFTNEYLYYLDFNYRNGYNLRL